MIVLNREGGQLMVSGSDDVVEEEKKLWRRVGGAEGEHRDRVPFGFLFIRR